MTTWSVHGDGDAGDIADALAGTVGFEPHDPLSPARLAEMEASDAWFLVKTHNLPPDDARQPAICILRDGRSAITSYWHYRNRPGDTGARFEDVVAGQVQFGAWGAHVAAWLDAPIERRLVLRYEDLVSDPVSAMQTVGGFLGLSPTTAKPPEFKELHALAPLHFRSGGDRANVAELEARWPALFNALHGSVQARLGYPPAAVDGPAEEALRMELGRMIEGARASERDAAASAEARAAEAASEARASAGIAEQARAAARAADEARLRAEEAAQDAAARLAPEAAAREAAEAEVAALRQELEGLRHSPFWRAREITVSALLATGIRHRP